MKPERPALSPLLRSDAQGMILAQLFMNPEDGFSISDLARFARTSVPTAMREVDRLLDARVLTARSIGRAKLVKVNRMHELYEPIKAIVSNSYGPAAVLPAALYGLDGLEEAYLFGPWAARLKREIEVESGEVDLLLVGYVNRIEASRAAARVEGYLGKAVNVRFVTSAEWANPNYELTREIKSKPMARLQLD